MTTAIYPASFDPITLGHVDVARRAAFIFEELIVGVYSRPINNLLFSLKERLLMTEEALKDIPNVRIETYNGLTVEFAREHNAQAIIRGLRMASDFEWELQLSLLNRTLEPEIETVCLMASQQYSFISSALLKDIARNHGNI
ncbi:MAG TPA: pantetheine-phosphate adenylyltransferase, partial [Anaerolineae bacterium]|nr:pantetheine-phosphate adenylyltransferase [Anaerolineae bacterium]